VREPIPPGWPRRHAPDDAREEIAAIAGSFEERRLANEPTGVVSDESADP
jgi:hypothetical protein